MSLEVEETLLILLENQYYFLLELVDGCYQVLISSRKFDSSICGWKMNFPFSNITSFAFSLLE